MPIITKFILERVVNANIKRLTHTGETPGITAKSVFPECSPALIRFVICAKKESKTSNVFELQYPGCSQFQYFIYISIPGLSIHPLSWNQTTMPARMKMC